MKLYRYKPLQVGFVVICPDRNPLTLRSTVNGIRSRYPGVSVVAAVPEDTNDAEMEVIGKCCPVFKGQNTITSLINVGLNHSKSPWSVVVISGSWIRPNLDKKYSYFVEDTKDILFPIVDGKYNFVDGSINGILIHQDAWKLVGNFCNHNPLAICKMMWATDAIEKGCRFKAVIGARII